MQMPMESQGVLCVQYRTTSDTVMLLAHEQHGAHSAK